MIFKISSNLVKDYQLKILAEGTEVDEQTYDPSEFERKWTNEDSNKKMMQEFDRLAWGSFKELSPGQKTGPGKTMVFAITKHHAARPAHFLNELHPELKGQYTEVIASDVADVNDLIRKFKREEYPQVAASENLEKAFAVMLHRAFSGDLTAKWREVHMKELLAEMGEQAKALETTNHSENTKEKNP